MNLNIHEGADNFRITGLKLFPMPKQHPMFNRPYIISPEGSALNTLYDRMQSGNTSVVGPSMINDITNRIISPSTVAIPTPINSGWFSQDRYIFLLVVEEEHFGLTKVNYLLGFTDHDGASNTQHGLMIEPRMMFYVNSVIETNRIMFNAPTGVVRTERLDKFYDVIKPYENTVFHAQRPKDVITTMESLTDQHHLGAAGVKIPDEFGNASDFQFATNGASVVSPYSPVVLPSKSTNNITSDFLTTVINGGIASRKKRSQQTTGQASFTKNNAIPVDIEPLIHNNKTLNKLSIMETGHSGRNTGTFSYNSLLRLDTKGANEFELFKIKDMPSLNRTGHTVQIGDHWHGQDPVTLAAYSLLGGALSLAVSKGIFELDLHINNKGHMPLEEVVKISHLDSPIKLNKQDLDILIRDLINRFIHQIYLPETLGGVYPLQASIHIDLVGVTKIYIDFLGYPPTWLTMPTTTSSYTTPVITTDPNITKQTGDKLNMLIHQVVGNSAPYTTPVRHNF